MIYQPPSRGRLARERMKQARKSEYRRTRINRSMQSGVKKTSSNPGANFFMSALALLFIYLKLTKEIDWSWWWVLAPLWAPLALLFTIVLMLLIFSALMYAAGAAWDRMMRWRKR